MLNWSDGKYKLTLGIGSLGMAAIMSELWKPFLPVWFMLVVTLIPLVVFIFIRAGEMNPRIVRFAQRAASIWYLIAASVLTAALLTTARLPQGWVIYQSFVLSGSIPCWLVLFGRCGREGHLDDGDENKKE